MEVDGQVHSPTTLPRIKISPFTLNSRLSGPQNRSGTCQDSNCDCWVGERRILYFLLAFVMHAVEDGRAKETTVFCFNKQSVNYSRVETVASLLH
jgi:hypothetical protein